MSNPSLRPPTPPGDLDERLLREATAACYLNARDLHSASSVLQRAGYRAQAVALAIIAFEELAKTIAYIRAAIRREFRHEALKGLKEHKVKQLISIKAGLAGLIAGDPTEGATWETGFRPSREYTVFLLLALASDSLTGPIPDKREAEDFYRTTGKAHVADPAQTKNAALYVDLEDGGLRTPERVAHLSTYYIDELEWFLDRVSVLPDLVRSDGDWEEIAGAVRSVLPSV